MENKRPLRVLLVEDSAEDAELVLRELRKSGFAPEHERVCTGASLQQALEQPWDIVISDFAMPQYNGLRAFELVREHDPSIPFVFCSGYLGEARAVRAMRAGARDFVVKSAIARLGAVVEREVSNPRPAKPSRPTQMDSSLETSLEVAGVGIIRVDAGNMRDELRWRDHSTAQLDAPTLDEVARSATVLEARGAARSLLGLTQELPSSLLPSAPTPRLRRLAHAIVELLHGRPGPRQGVVRLTHDDATRAVLLSCQLPERREADEHILISLVEVDALAAELSATIQAERLEALTRFGGHLAHDLNNVTGIIGPCCEMLAETTGETDGGPINVITRANERLREFSEKLGVFSRRDPYVEAPHDLNASVGAAVTEIEAQLPAGIDVQLALSPHPLPVVVAPEDVATMVAELVHNAAEAMPEGGRIMLSTDCGARRDGRGFEARLSVVDDGAGIDPAVREILFEPRVSTSQRRGAGWGLSLVHGNLRRARGRVRINGAADGRNTVEIVLPLDISPSEDE